MRPLNQTGVTRFAVTIQTTYTRIYSSKNVC